jgi:hypothetical protein
MIVGFTGFKQSGKDTAALALYEMGYEKVSFAHPIYQIAAIFDFDLDDKNAVHPVWRITLRQFLQVVGTEMFRNIMDDDVWIKHMEHIHGLPERAVVTDVRFPNEAAFIRRKGGIVIRICRDTKEYDCHASEMGQSSITPDYTINNNGSVEELHQAVRSILDARNID